MADYYELLEVAPDADLIEIRRAYRRLARRYHPDLNQQAHDARIKLLNEAYATLKDPEKRAAYDARRVSPPAPSEPRMTWREGLTGFVRELKRELREE
jgi:curved DNA-binding protein